MVNCIHPLCNLVTQSATTQYTNRQIKFLRDHGKQIYWHTWTRRIGYNILKHSWEWELGPVHTYPFSFKNAIFSLRYLWIRLPSTRIRWKRTPKTQLFENATRDTKSACKAIVLIISSGDKHCDFLKTLSSRHVFILGNTNILRGWKHYCQ